MLATNMFYARFSKFFVFLCLFYRDSYTAGLRRGGWSMPKVLAKTRDHYFEGEDNYAQQHDVVKDPCPDMFGKS